jgi:putative ABC transport system permease protein
MKTNITNHVTGDVRIMNRKFVENERIMPLQFFIDGTQSKLDALNATKGIQSATPRTETMVSIYRNGEQIPCKALGIDFKTSPILSGPNSHLVEGAIPEPSSSGVLVTPSLAKELSLKPGSRFTALTRTAISGSNGKTFTVSGILSLSDSDFSGREFFADWRTMGEYLRMGGNAMQIQVFLDKTNDLEAGAKLAEASLEKNFGAETVGGLQIVPWYDASGFYGFLKIAGIIFMIYGIIFFALASTVIFNTMMMSVLERKKEIGTLSALGMGSRTIISLFLTEASLIALVGTLAGIVSGGILVALWGHFGFDVEAAYGTDMKGLGYSKLIYPALTAGQYAAILITGLCVSIAACFMPARMASKIEPAEALADR